MKQSSVLRTGSLTLEESLAPDRRAAIYFRSTSDAAREFYSLEPAQGIDTSLRINRHNAAGQIIASGVLKDTMTNPVDAEPTFSAATVTGNLTVGGAVNAKLDIVRITGGGPVPVAYFGKHIYAAAGNYSSGITLPTTGMAPGTTVTVINGSGGAITENTTGRLIVDDAAATFIWHTEGPAGPSYWIASLTEKSRGSFSVGKLNADPGYAIDAIGAIKASTRIEAPVISATAPSPAVSLTSAGRTNLLGPIMVGGTTANNYLYALDVVGSGNMSGGLTVGGGLLVNSDAAFKTKLTVDNSGSLTVTGVADVGGLATLSGGAAVGSAGLTVSGPTTLSGGTTVGSAGLTVSGPTTLSGGAAVGSAGLTVSGPTTLSGETTANSVTINGLTTLKDGVSVPSGNVTVAGGNLAVGTALQVDSINSRVGVNNMNPQANLHVTGNMFVTGSQTNIILEHDDVYNRGLIRVFDVQTGPRPLIFGSDGGSVGIGNVISPQAKLDVDGTIRGKQLRTVFDEFDSQPLVCRKDGYFQGIISQEGASDLLIQTGPFQNLMLKANGHLGINTSNPTAQVHMSFGKTAAQDWMVSEGSSEPTPAIAPGLGWYSSMMGKGMSVNSANQITVYSDGLNAFGAGLLSGSEGVLDFLTGVQAGATTNITRNPQDVTRMRISGTGNVGIGTLTPGQRLDVSGGVAASTYTFRQNAADDASPVITYRAIPVDQGGNAAGTRTELILFHSNDGSNENGADRITLRAPEISLQTYDNTDITSIANANGANDRIVINQGGSMTVNTVNTVFNNEVNIKSSLNVNGALTCGSLSINGSTSIAAPTGSIMMWSGINDPAGWFVCDGRLLNTEEYPVLSGLIRNVFRTAPTDSTFYLPDMRGRFPVGRDVTDISFNASNFTQIGNVGGAKTVTLTTAQIPSHSHGIVGSNQDSNDDNAYLKSSTNNAGVQGFTDTTGGGQAHENRPPFFTINYIIKA